VSSFALSGMEISDLEPPTVSCYLIWIMPAKRILTATHWSTLAIEKVKWLRRLWQCSRLICLLSCARVLLG
jgi:hypothetical protein